MIELGIDMFGDLRIDPISAEAGSAAQRMQEMMEEIKLMDEVGLDFFAVGEHHRRDFAVSSPEIVLAAAAAITKNIKLSSAVSVLSSADPVKLFQDFTNIDLISNGRAEIMVGRGSFIESFPLYGFDLNDYAELFEEKLELLMQLNRQVIITWSGKFRKPLADQPIFPRPKKGALPIWVAVGGTAASVVRAGKLGLPVMFAIIGGTIERFKPLFDLYGQAWEKGGHDRDKFQVGIHMHALFGSSSQRLGDDYYPLYAASMNRVGADRGWPPYQKSQYDFGRSPHGHLIIGDANEAVEKIIYAIETFGLTRFSAHMDTGAPDHHTLMKSIEIYGTQIAPKVRQALKKQGS